MMSKVLSFEIPEKVSPYREPEDFIVIMDDLMVDLRKTMGIAGEMMHEHKYLILSWLNHEEFMQPKEQWSKLANEAIRLQKESFNSKLIQLKESPVTLLGGEEAIIKRAEFVVCDITDDRQELARLLGIITDILFLELTVYSPSKMKWYSVVDYQIKSIGGASV